MGGQGLWSEIVRAFSGPLVATDIASQYHEETVQRLFTIYNISLHFITQLAAMQQSNLPFSNAVLTMNEVFCMYLTK